MGSLNRPGPHTADTPCPPPPGGHTVSQGLWPTRGDAPMPPDGLSFSEETPPTDVRVGNYRIVRRIGQGGWGEVFEAHHVHGLRAAIKVLRAHVQATPGRQQRFFREAIAAGTIHHPGIVRVFDVGRLSDGRAYILMELIRGESLRRHLQHRVARALPLAHIISIGRQIASAMAAMPGRVIVAPR